MLALINLYFVRIILVAVTSIILLNSCSSSGSNKNIRKAELYYGEDHLTRLKQLTFEGENSAASFSPDNKKVIFESTRDGLRCNAIFIMDNDGSSIDQLSSGKGIAGTASYAPDNNSILFSSTQKIDYQCPQKPEFSKDYIWLLYSEHDIYSASSSGGDEQRLTKSKDYDGGAVYSPKGDKIVFTSARTGDYELFIMNADGSQVKQLTRAAGYDGDVSFSPDGQFIVWRASRPKGNDLHDYRFQLSRGIIRAGKFELYMMKLNGGKPVKLTHNGAANFSPTFDPQGKNIIFTSNVGQKDGRNYDLYMINFKTRKQERLTYYSGFDGYPVFSSDGKKLLFTSSRNFRYKAEKNIFIVDWVAEGIYTR